MLIPWIVILLLVLPEVALINTLSLPSLSFNLLVSLTIIKSMNDSLFFLDYCKNSMKQDIPHLPLYHRLNDNAIPYLLYRLLVAIRSNFITAALKFY